ncbi:MAG: exosortase K [Blastocatellia bacterium]
MKPPFTWNRAAQGLVILLLAWALKRHYAAAGADELRWILAPTTALTGMISGLSFTFESRAGYINRDIGFLIAPSCAGVNFLITAFLLLTLRKLSGGQTHCPRWRLIPLAAMIAFLMTIIANTVRICTALQMRRSSVDQQWLNAEQLHRFEGIFVYFGFLVLLYVISERPEAGNPAGPIRKWGFPLLVYYATTLAVPLVNGAYQGGSAFAEHALFVLLIPLLWIAPLAIWQLYRTQRLFCDAE